MATGYEEPSGSLSDGCHLISFDVPEDTSKYQVYRPSISLNFRPGGVAIPK